MPGAWATGGGLGRTGEARVGLGAWVYSGWHSENESVSPDGRMPLGYRGMCYCPCLGLLPARKEHSMGRGGGGAHGDLEKNLRSGLRLRLLRGGRHPETGAGSLLWGNSLHSVPEAGRAGVQEEESTEVIAPFPSFG